MCNDTSETQTGCTVEYKQRHKQHKESFENPDVKQTCLSQHIWKKLKATNPHIPYSIVWEEVDRGPHYNPSMGHTIDTKYQRAGCSRSQLIESYLKALIANRLAAKKHFGN